MKALIAGFFCALALSAHAAEPMALNYQAFGDVAVHGDAASATGLVFILADNAVDEATRASLAAKISQRGVLAAVVDLGRYTAELGSRKDYCAYHSWEFEKLSKFVQKALGVPEYHRPLFLGLGAGGALAYTTLTEAPQATFAGFVAVGSCPMFHVTKKLCSNKDDTWEPTDTDLNVQLIARDAAVGPWVFMPANAPGTCAPADIAKLFSETKGASILPASPAPWGGPAWQDQVVEATARALAAIPAHVATEGIADLPLEEVEATKEAHKTFAIIVTGDGGWAGIDREIADQLTASGMNVVGFNSLQFFWRERTPDEATQAISRVITHYAQRWQADHVLVVGYSFGADITPFIINRLPDDQRALIQGVALLAMGENARFEFRIGDWVGPIKGADSLPIQPEIMAMPAMPMLCVYGSEEEEEGLTTCPKLPPERARLFKTEGGHHFDGDYARITREILTMVK